MPDTEFACFMKKISDKQITIPGEGVLYHRVCDIAEDEYDLLSYQKAMQDYQSDPVTYTLDEVEYELGLK